ncbi:hypothetical protein INR49_018757 [Caranx melampygus]|nr:hypothetical protein INR49_018757 [Caranx melampygus]
MPFRACAKKRKKFFPLKPNKFPQRRFLPDDDSPLCTLCSNGTEVSRFPHFLRPFSWTHSCCVHVLSENIHTSHDTTSQWTDQLHFGPPEMEETEPTASI